MTGQRPSQAEQLLALADRAGYTFLTYRDDPYGVIPGESIARPLRGGRGSIRAELARLFAEEHDRAPSAHSLADVMLALEGRAYSADERALHLRVAYQSGAVWLDLGTADGDIIRVTADGWAVADGPGPLFRRTRLTGPLPRPAEPGNGDLGALRVLLRIGDESWPLVVAWLVAVLVLPGQPVPVLALTGEQGTAKSTQSRLLVSLVDPSDCPLRAGPRDVEGWAVAAAASRVVGLDNVSHIEPWLSDALCRGVTGDGLVRRALYTDSDVSVLNFRRAILINGITLTGLRGDLADRLLRVELEQIPDSDRLDETDLAAQWTVAHPAALGGLLDLIAQVLARLPQITLPSKPRMADYAKVLAAVDQVMGTTGLRAYLGLREQLAAEAVEEDLIGSAIARFAAGVSIPWQGTAAELLKELSPKRTDGSPKGPEELPKGWPGSSRAMAARITRAAPMLRAIGVRVDELLQQGVKRQAKRWAIGGSDNGGETRGDIGNIDFSSRADRPQAPPGRCPACPLGSDGTASSEEVAGRCPDCSFVPSETVSAGQDTDRPADIRGDILRTSGTAGHPPGEPGLDVPGVSAGQDIEDNGNILPRSVDRPHNGSVPADMLRYEPPPPATVEVGGVQVSEDEIVSAIEILGAVRSTAVKQPLAKAGHRLAEMDYAGVATAELAAHPELRTAAGTKQAQVGHTKAAVLHHLTVKLANLGGPTFDDLMNGAFVYEPGCAGDHDSYGGHGRPCQGQP
jgi:hypothetical protein